MNVASDPAAFACLKKDGLILLAERRGMTRMERLKAVDKLMHSFSRKANGTFFF
jgi:CCR4-NOT transcriptional regulation complex NOT5 subunit